MWKGGGDEGGRLGGGGGVECGIGGCERWRGRVRRVERMGVLVEGKEKKKGGF